MTGHGAIEVAKTVLEVADVAWTAVECRHHHHQHHVGENKSPDAVKDDGFDSDEGKLEALRSENRRLRSLLEQNLKLLQNLSDSPELSQDCPPDFHHLLVSTVNSKEFLTLLESLRQALVEGNQNHFPFKEATGDDLQSADILINVNQKEPSWWVWIPEDMVPRNSEEESGIDHENYVVITEEHVVDAVANFMAKCVLSNPKAKNLRPEELQKALFEELGSMSKLGKVVHIWHAGKMFYTLATWGLAFAGLYQTRAVLKIGAKGVHVTSKAILRAL